MPSIRLLKSREKQCSGARVLLEKTNSTSTKSFPTFRRHASLLYPEGRLAIIVSSTAEFRQSALKVPDITYVSPLVRPIFIGMHEEHAAFS